MADSMTDSLPTVLETVNSLVSHFSVLSDEELDKMQDEIDMMQLELAKEKAKRSSSQPLSLPQSLAHQPPRQLTQSWVYEAGKGYHVYEDGVDVTERVMSEPKSVCAGKNSEGWLTFRKVTTSDSLFWA